MAFLDKGMFCPLSEYEKYEATRVLESEMNSGDLYTAMFRLQGEKLQAAKLPVRIMDISTQTGGMAIRLAFLNEDLEPQKEADTRVANGFIVEFTPAMVIGRVGSSQQVKIDSAYCRDYFDEMYGFMNEASTALTVSAGLDI